MEIFKQTYASSLDTINIQQDMLVDALVQTDDKLNPLEILSDLSKLCVSKYRSSIPTAAITKSQMNACVTTASSQLNNMVNSPLNTRNYLDSYYKNNFEKEIDRCQRTYSALPLNNTMCITTAVSNTLLEFNNKLIYIYLINKIFLDHHHQQLYNYQSKNLCHTNGCRPVFSYSQYQESFGLQFYCTKQNHLRNC